ncbi:MAG: hypothetical protein L3J24_14685 [Xanthomonadales bacterium]|nr:hypothetical protein [Xanthomonadales bacterium]
MPKKFLLILVITILATLVPVVLNKQKNDIEQYFLRTSLTIENILSLSETYRFLELIQSDDIVTLERELARKMDEQLFTLMQTGGEEFLEKNCIPYVFLKYRTNLEGKDSNIKLTELLQQKVKPNFSCKLQKPCKDDR